MDACVTKVKNIRKGGNETSRYTRYLTSNGGLLTVETRNDDPLVSKR